jgi:alkaline phosphatase D
MVAAPMTTLTRRGLLASFAAAAVTERVLPWAWAARPEPPLRAGSFAQGVASGFPARHGAALWTRLDRPGTLTLEVARDPGFRHVVQRRAVRAAAIRDNTVHTAATGLAPGEDYWYRFHTRTTTSPAGRFRTRRPPDSREPLRVAFWSCQNWQTGYYTAHGGLAREPDLDLIVCVGDFIYEAASDPGPRTDDIGPDRSAQTLDEYRAKYRLYRTDPNLQAVHAAANFAICWDDHEVMSSYYDETPGNAQGRAARVPFPARRANAYDAFFEHMPLKRLHRAHSAPAEGPHAGSGDRIYRRIPLGANADLFLTDLHQYASPPPDCGATPTAGPVLLGPCPQATDPSRTLLGPAQRRWLVEGLTSSTAAWKLWGTSMMLMALDSAPNTPFTVGEWSGWEGERNDLAGELHRLGARDLAAFSGDIHTFFAGRWTTTGRSDGQPVGVEFVSGSITSSGIADSFGGQGAFTDRVTLVNPHIDYANTLRRGYAVAEAGPDELRVTFRSPATVKQPQAPVDTLAAFTVARGDPAVRS